MEQSKTNDPPVSSLNSIPEPRLRGLRWRVMLGVLPPCPTSIANLRRAAADGRRRYADLRRRLVVDPHIMEDPQKNDSQSVDNPLSQDPESVWGRYFENTKLEGSIETDLTRLYPEQHGSLFQTAASQAMMRRVLLVWSHSHPKYGYRQGMHELLAPLVYVLHKDISHLSEVRGRYEDPFEDRFDAPSGGKISNSCVVKRIVPKVTSNSTGSMLKETTFNGEDDFTLDIHPEDAALAEPDDFGFSLKTMLLGSDSYGSEGELGALLSARFLEHDAYCMFEALLTGNGSGLVLADYFLNTNEAGTPGTSPVLEACDTVYETLASADIHLYNHLVGLGIEPQFFSLRWFRVLFSREFELHTLLTVWDAIFSAPNTNKKPDDVKTSPRCSFIFSFAVSILLSARSMLFSASNTTVCLQKLLNFSKSLDIKSLLENARLLNSLVDDSPTPSQQVSIFSGFLGNRRHNKHKSWSDSAPFPAHIPVANKVLNNKLAGSPKALRQSVPESYWEEIWFSSLTVEERENPSSAGISTKSKINDVEVNKPKQNTVDSATAAKDQRAEDTNSGSVTRNLFPESDAIPSHSGVGHNESSTPYRVDETCTDTKIGDCGSSKGGEEYLEAAAKCDSELKSDSSSASDSLKCPAKDESRVTLKTLGQSMVESIQILENALSQKATLGREGASYAIRETVDCFSKTFLNAKGQMSALTALGELRKISNSLLQM